jgi:hypothetical protein
MEIVRVDLKNRKQVRDFLSLPFRIYKDIPQWVPPLAMDARRYLDPKHHPFYKHSQAEFFLAYESDRSVGRLAVLDNRHYNEFNAEKTAFFFLFECEDDQAAANGLFAAASQWARQRGLTRIVGPKGFTALDGFGLLVKGFEHRPALGLPYNPPYYPALVEGAGFIRHSDAVSGYLARETARFPERIHELAERVAARRGLKVVDFKKRRELSALIPHLKELYNASLGGTSESTPLTDEDVKGMADQLLWFADPKLVKLVRKVGDPGEANERIVGFLLAYPDISAALQKTKGRLFPFGWIALLRELRTTEWANINGAGMVEEYRGLGGTAILFSEIAKTLSGNTQYKYGDIVQIGVENENMQREMRNFGVDFYKVHRVYLKEL